MKRQLRYGMIGGGPGAFIGAVHRIAASLDNKAVLVCGVFSSDPIKSMEMGEELFLPKDRIYPSFEEMIKREAALPEDQRMDFVSIVTPNHLHFLPAKLAMESGFHVICDKPATLSTEEAVQLAEVVKKTEKEFALTHTYTGYPMIKQAAQMVQNGVFGKIRKVVVEYPQGWMATPVEKTDNKQAGWRSDPSKSGRAGAVGDIGTHAANLAETITGLKIVELAADVSKFVEGRVLDDDANVLLRFENGAKGVLHCSQICAGEENDVNIRLWGEKGGLEWHQHEPNTMKLKWIDKPTELYRTGKEYMGERAQLNTRTPWGHPEGYLEAFANLYNNFIQVVAQRVEGVSYNDIKYRDYPGIDEGIRGMRFIDAVIDSGERNAEWTKL